MAESGTVRWPARQPIWEFDYELLDDPHNEGIVLRHVRYRGRLVFFKASMPMIRVNYYGTNYQPYDYLNCNNAPHNPKVVVTSHFGDNPPSVWIEAYHHGCNLGKYKITERWIFQANGVILPQFWSSGISKPYNHTHHTYWRMDFDIDNWDKNLVLEHINSSWSPPDVGYGAGWRPIRVEAKLAKNRQHSNYWAIIDKTTGRGYFIYPGPYDGFADNFASGDLWVMRYNGVEEQRQALHQGNSTADQLELYLNGEGVDGADVVIWYCSQLTHLASPDHADPDEWHVSGPILVPCQFPTRHRPYPWTYLADAWAQRESYLASVQSIGLPDR